MQTRFKFALFIVAVSTAGLFAEDSGPAGKLSGPFKLKYPEVFGKPTLPKDNALTHERIALGEKLFHDTILSIDGTVSCAACHVTEFAFGDDVDVSRGFEGRMGRRNSLPLFNLAWKPHFFWDGRAPTVRDQVIKPIQDHREMAANLGRVVMRLNRRKEYRDAFQDAYEERPTRENLALALENFLLTIVSDNSKFDQAKAKKVKLSEGEERGRKLFFTRHEDGGAGCFQCHDGPNFSDFEFRNNGLPPIILDPDDGEDLGRYEVTDQEKDRFRFLTPSLRNIAITPPYMHDGRFKKLEDVVHHYNKPLHKSPTLDPKLKEEGLNLSAEDQAALVEFLKTLTDPKFLE